MNSFFESDYERQHHNDGRSTHNRINIERTGRHDPSKKIEGGDPARLHKLTKGFKRFGWGHGANNNKPPDGIPFTQNPTSTTSTDTGAGT